MSDLPGVVVNACAHLAGASLAAFWQGLVLVALVAAALGLSRGWSAARRSAIWLGIFFLIIGLEFCSTLGLLPQSALLMGKQGQSAVYPVDSHWAVILIALSLTVSLVRVIRLGAGLGQASALASQATPVAHGLKGLAPCFESAEVTRPCVVGCVSPRILLPVGLARQLTGHELEQVLLHEEEHIRRGDPWINLAQKLALALFPINPALWLVERRLCTERELACDDQVMRVTGARKSYALCLVRLAEHGVVSRGRALALGAWERRPELLRRIERILGEAPAELQGWRANGALAGILLLAAAGGAALARCPQVVAFTGAPEQLARMSSPVQSSSPAAIGYGRVQEVKAVRTTTAVLRPTLLLRPAKTMRLHTRRSITPSVGALMAIAPDSAFRPIQVSWSQARTGSRSGSDGQPHAAVTPAQSGPVAVPAVFYIVATDGGWLVIQI